MGLFDDLKERPKRVSTTLCTSCRRSTVIERDSEIQNNRIIHCGSIDRNIDFVVRRCSDYIDATLPSMESLEKTAWILDPSKRRIGFDADRWVKPGTEEHDRLVKGY